MFLLLAQSCDGERLQDRRGHHKGVGARTRDLSDNEVLLAVHGGYRHHHVGGGHVRELGRLKISCQSLRREATCLHIPQQGQ
jgi:hypothetical protein